MTRTMRDSTNIDDIPVAGTDLVVYYVDGLYAVRPGQLDRFPDAVHVPIAVNAWHAAAMGDCEQDDMAPADTPGWVGRSRGQGWPRPAVYCNRGNEDAVDQALHDAGVATTDACVVVATLDGTVVSGTTAHGYPIVACQDRGEAQTGGHYDESVVFDDDWPRLAAAPPPVPPPAPSPQEDDMTTQDVAAVLITAYRLREVRQAGEQGRPIDPAKWHFDQTDPGNFGNQVAAYPATDLHTLVNNIDNA